MTHTVETEINGRVYDIELKIASDFQDGTEQMWVCGVIQEVWDITEKDGEGRDKSHSAGD